MNVSFSVVYDIEHGRSGLVLGVTQRGDVVWGAVYAANNPVVYNCCGLALSLFHIRA